MEHAQKKVAANAQKVVTVLMVIAPANMRVHAKVAITATKNNNPLKEKPGLNRVSVVKDSLTTETETQ